MLSRLPARHAHLFSNDLYTRERDIYFFIYKTYKMVCIVCSTPKSPDKSGFKLHTMAKNGVQDSVHGVQGSVHERRNARIGMPSPCRIPSVRPPTSDCRPQGGHPCIERMRDAQGRSNALRPLQRRFKARKKPDGYTSTPTGLKRLKTQITAFHGNENGKGTPSGVPQPIHKRKLILVKEEFDASSFGGTRHAANKRPTAIRRRFHAM